MARRSKTFRQRKAAETRRGWIIIGLVVLLALFVAWQVIVAFQGRVALSDNLCPVEGERSQTVVLVDLSDPLTTAQRQAFLNELEILRDEVPKHGRLAIYRVDAADDELLRPVFDKCNPGDGSELSEANANPASARRRWEGEFDRPLRETFTSLTQALGSDRSPILESVQSVAVSTLQRPNARDLPRRLVIVSDLLQNTDGISFYAGLPTAEQLISTDAFRAAESDLGGVDVNLWMLSRPGVAHLQTTTLGYLWQDLVGRMRGRVTKVRNISG